MRERITLILPVAAMATLAAYCKRLLDQLNSYLSNAYYDTDQKVQSELEKFYLTGIKEGFKQGRESTLTYVNKNSQQLCGRARQEQQDKCEKTQQLLKNHYSHKYMLENLIRFREEREIPDCNNGDLYTCNKLKVTEHLYSDREKQLKLINQLEQEAESICSEAPSFSVVLPDEFKYSPSFQPTPNLLGNAPSLYTLLFTTSDISFLGISILLILIFLIIKMPKQQKKINVYGFEEKEDNKLINLINSFSEQEKEKLKNESIPDHFCCGITWQLMTQPVRIAGDTTDKNYELEEIRKWLETNPKIPLMNTPVPTQDIILTRNRPREGQIIEYLTMLRDTKLSAKQKQEDPPNTPNQRCH